MDTHEILTLVCLGACVTVALLTLLGLGLAGLCLKLYTEFYKERQRPATRPPATVMEGTPHGDKLATLQGIPGALNPEDRELFVRSYIGKFSDEPALAIAAGTAIRAYYSHVLGRVLHIRDTEQRGR